MLEKMLPFMQRKGKEFRPHLLTSLLLIIFFSQQVLCGLAFAETTREKKKYTLYLSIEGVGSSYPRPGLHEYEEGTRVKLVPTLLDVEKWDFDRWEINGRVLSEEDYDNPWLPIVTITMYQNYTARAYFKEIEETKPSSKTHTLTISSSGQAYLEPSPGHHEYKKGKRVLLTAYPPVGWEFERWLINGVQYDYYQVTVTMDEDIFAQAYLKEIPWEADEEEQEAWDWEEGEDVIPVEGILLTPTSHSVGLESEAVFFSAHVIPLHATDPGIIWSSSNPDFAIIGSQLPDGAYVANRAYTIGWTMVTAQSRDNPEVSAVAYVSTRDRVARRDGWSYILGIENRVDAPHPEITPFQRHGMLDNPPPAELQRLDRTITQREKEYIYYLDKVLDYFWMKKAVTNTFREIYRGNILNAFKEVIFGYISYLQYPVTLVDHFLTILFGDDWLPKLVNPPRMDIPRHPGPPPPFPFQ